jgi:hypothetical protein
MKVDKKIRGHIYESSIWQTVEVTVQNSGVSMLRDIVNSKALSKLKVVEIAYSFDKFLDVESVVEELLENGISVEGIGHHDITLPSLDGIADSIKLETYSLKSETRVRLFGRELEKSLVDSTLTSILGRYPLEKFMLPKALQRNT